MMSSSTDYGKIIKLVGDAILIVDQQGTIRFVNPAACTLFQRSEEELVGAPFGFPISSEARSEIDVFRKGGQVAFAELLAVDIEWEGEASFLATLRDITERRRNEQKLAEAKAVIEANRLKSRFLNSLSDELRNPITTIIDYTGVIQDDLEKNYFVDVPDDIEHIRQNAFQLMATINQLLSLADIEGGIMDLVLEMVNTQQLINGIATELRELAKANQIQLELTIHEDCQTLYTDRKKLHQILFNLLHNAYKFTEDGLVQLRIQPTVVDKEAWIKFEVEDHGVGIDQKTVNHLINAFSSENPPSMKGLGIGLTLSQHLGRLLHGYIDVQSVVGEGSIFTLYLPHYIARVN